MPLLSIFTKQISFIDWFVAMDGKEYESLEAAQAEAVATLNYGVFISNVLNFLIMAFVVFLIVKFLNKLKRPDQTAPSTKKCPQCYSDINVNATKCPCCTADIQSNS
jgi:large conductance mechanosensitive channel